jgi:hypothetical protein
MNCQDLQSSLSLYLYGELDFAQEEEVESHLAECAACQLNLAREKEWHALTNAQVKEPPLRLLAQCRQQLRPALTSKSPSWWRWSVPFDISFSRWSPQIALASLCLFMGFAGARWMDQRAAQFANLSNTQIRDIQADESGLVRIMFDQPREIEGRLDDPNVRSLLLSGARQSDAGVRFSSVQLLNRESGVQHSDDFRQVLFDAARNDPNPAVRLQAVDGLRRFAADPAALETIKFVLAHDDNPIVRSQAIDIIAPPDRDISITPAMTETIQDVLRSAPQDEYVRARCAQFLTEAKLAVVY